MYLVRPRANPTSLVCARYMLCHILCLLRAITGACPQNGQLSVTHGR